MATDPAQLAELVLRFGPKPAADLHSLLSFRNLLAEGGPRGLAAGIWYAAVRARLPFETRSIEREVELGRTLTPEEVARLRRDLLDDEATRLLAHAGVEEKAARDRREQALALRRAAMLLAP